MRGRCRIGGVARIGVLGKLQDELRGDVANAERAERKPYRDDADCAICWLRPRRSVWLCKEDAADLAVVELCDGVECGAWCNLGYARSGASGIPSHARLLRRTYVFVLTIYARHRERRVLPVVLVIGALSQF